MYKLYCFLQANGAADAQPTIDVFAAGGQEAGRLLQQTGIKAVAHVQTQALSTQLNDEPPAYAGALELYFDDAETALKTYRSSAELSPLWRRETVTLAAALVGSVRTVIRLPAHHFESGVKGVFPFRRRADLGVAEFQARWWHGHGPIAAKTQDALYYPQCHPLSACYEEERPLFDGVTELHWSTYEQAVAAMESDQMRVDQASDAEHFVEPDSVTLFFGKEEVITAP